MVYIIGGLDRVHYSPRRPDSSRSDSERSFRSRGEHFRSPQFLVKTTNDVEPPWNLYQVLSPYTRQIAAKLQTPIVISSDRPPVWKEFHHSTRKTNLDAYYRPLSRPAPTGWKHKSQTLPIMSTRSPSNRAKSNLRITKSIYQRSNQHNQGPLAPKPPSLQSPQRTRELDHYRGNPTFRSEEGESPGSSRPKSAPNSQVGSTRSNPRYSEDQLISALTVSDRFEEVEDSFGFSAYDIIMLEKAKISPLEASEHADHMNGVASIRELISSIRKARDLVDPTNGIVVKVWKYLSSPGECRILKARDAEKLDISEAARLVEEVGAGELTLQHLKFLNQAHMLRVPSIEKLSEHVRDIHAEYTEREDLVRRIFNHIMSRRFQLFSYPPPSLRLGHIDILLDKSRANSQVIAHLWSFEAAGRRFKTPEELTAEMTVAHARLCAQQSKDRRTLRKFFRNHGAVLLDTETIEPSDDQLEPFISQPGALPAGFDTETRPLTRTPTQFTTIMYILRFFSQAGHRFASFESLAESMQQKHKELQATANALRLALKRDKNATTGAHAPLLTPLVAESLTVEDVENLIKNLGLALVPNIIFVAQCLSQTGVMYDSLDKLAAAIRAAGQKLEKTKACVKTLLSTSTIISGTLTVF